MCHLFLFTEEEMKRLQVDMSVDPSSAYNQVAFSYNAHEQPQLQPQPQPQPENVPEKEPVPVCASNNGQDADEASFIPPPELCMPEGMIAVSESLFFLIMILN